MRRLAALLLALLVAAQAPAEPGGLIADQVRSDPSQLIAEGNVVVFIDGHKISTDRITYFKPDDRLEIEGALTIIAPEGDVITGDAAILHPGQRQAILRQARLMLNQRVQVTAANLAHDNGTTALRRAALTSCHVCPGRRPLWEIRAESITYSEAAQRIWFGTGSFHIKGVPVMITPPLSIPAPGVSRARGLLRPTLKRDGTTGPTLRLPYFIPLGDHRDLTVTPRLSQHHQTLELRYRQALSRGSAEILTYASPRSRKGQAPGAWMRAQLAWEFPHQIRLSGDIEATSRPGYLGEFGLDGRAHLDHALQLEQILPRSRARLRYTRYAPLRQDAGTLAHRRDHLEAELDLRRALAGGFAYLRLRGNGYRRELRHAGPGAFHQALLSGQIGWRGRAIIGPGFEIGAEAALRRDYFAYQRKLGPAQDGSRNKAAIAASLAWPLRSEAAGMRQSLTPRITASWSRQWGPAPLNDDSLAPELDEASLHRFTSLPGQTRLEAGGRIGASLSWEGLSPSGRSHYLTLGRLWQEAPPQGATPGTGLARALSDWTLAAGTAGTHYEIDTRLAFGPGGLSRADLRGALRGARGDLALRHAYLAADPAAGRGQDLQMAHLSGGWQAAEGLRLSGEAEYDLALREPRRAKLGLDWRNECVRMALSASRRFASSVNNAAKTDYQFEITIDGFSTSAGPAPLRSCEK